MQDVRNKYVPPAVNQLAFNCPHCGALAQQFWLSTLAERLKKDNIPLIFTPESAKEHSLDHIEEMKERRRLAKHVERLAQGRPFLEQTYRNSIDLAIHNVSMSHCYNCSEIAIWIYDKLLWPARGEAPLPNPDLPAEVRGDYDEAGTILDLSPRGAAALLRLAIQKLCVHLKEPGESINSDIAALVKKGLDPLVQQALDVVRVIGNNAVHPDQIELKDDRATAENLFGLVNLIAEIMISQPKHVNAMYEGLPEGAKDHIAKRDEKKP